eukprot:3192800-Rhodomonas_salina.3
MGVRVCKWLNRELAGRLAACVWTSSAMYGADMGYAAARTRGAYRARGDRFHGTEPRQDAELRVYGATRDVFKSLSRLRSCKVASYAAATRCPVLTQRVLRPGYSLPTEARARDRYSLLSAYARAMRYPSWPLHSKVSPPVVLRLRYEVSGIDIARSPYCPTQSLHGVRC